MSHTQNGIVTDIVSKAKFWLKAMVANGYILPGNLEFNVALAIAAVLELLCQLFQHRIFLCSLNPRTNLTVKLLNDRIAKGNLFI